MEKSGRISRLSLLLPDWPQADQSHGWAFQFQSDREAARGVRLTNNVVKILRRADETRFHNRSTPPWNVRRSHAQARLRAGEVTDENRRRRLRRVHARNDGHLALDSAAGLDAAWRFKESGESAERVIILLRHAVFVEEAEPAKFAVKQVADIHRRVL